MSQQNFGPLVKTHVNTYTGKKYADLADVIAATQPSLSKNGISVVQVPIRKDDAQEAGVLTILAHSSGEWISVELILPATMKAKDGVTKFDQQSIGSAITYARRYTWQALVGVAAEEDDDGNAATDQYDSRPSPPPARTVAAPPVSKAKANQGQEPRPNEKPKAAPEPPPVTPAASQTRDPKPDAPAEPPANTTPVAEKTPAENAKVIESANYVPPKTVIPTPQGDKPTKSQLDGFINRVRYEIKPALEKAGLVPKKNKTTGQLLKDYIVFKFGTEARELNDLSVSQWDAFLNHYEVMNDNAAIVAEIDKGGN